MKHLYKFLTIAMVSLLFAGSLYAQESPREVMIRELNTYDVPITSQNTLIEHPLLPADPDNVSPDKIVTFDAVIVSYPKNSGLATADEGESGGEPGRIHLYVIDVNAIDEGREGMGMQIVVEGAARTELEGFFRGDVVRFTGHLDNNYNTIQFNTTEIPFRLGNVYSGQYTNLEPLIDPVVIDLSEINQPSDDGSAFTWIAENYTKYAHQYIKLEGLRVEASDIGSQGRPYMVMSEGNNRIMTNDMSLRYRNDLPKAYSDGEGGYGFVVEEDGGELDTLLSLGYNYRRLDVDGEFVPPPAGAVVDISGFYLINPSFDPQGIDGGNMNQSTVRIIPWEDGIRWTADGDNPENRTTEGIPDDLEVLGYAPILDNFSAVPDSGVANDDQVEVSVDVVLPENDYTLNDVEISYSAYPYTANSGDTVTTSMTQNGNTYSFTFDSYDDFTTVDYTITATAETPDGVTTTAIKDSLFHVESSTQTSPVAFSEPSGTYENAVDIELSSFTSGADIYYTTDGSDPDETSELYTGSISLDITDSTTTIKAIAVSEDLDNSPISERTYVVVLDAMEATTLADLRTFPEGTPVQFTGEAVITFTQGFRNQKYIQDETGAILIDDVNQNIPASYGVGDVVTGLIGDLTVHQGVLQLQPVVSPGESPGTAEITPAEVTLSELDLNIHESMLVTVSDVTFEDMDSGTLFDTGTAYPITDGSLSGDATYDFYTAFYDADYIETEIPTGTVKLTAIVGDFSGQPQLTARNSGDIEVTTSNEQDGMPQKFALEQNYPNPFNPTTVIQYSLANPSNVKLQIFDILGREVATLVNETQTAGAYSVNFDARALSSGTYFYRIQAGDFTSIKKMMLIK